jgi:Tfp pilus assembly protein PilV
VIRLSSISGKSVERSTRYQARAGFSIVEALMSSMVLAAVMAGLLTVADMTFKLEERERNVREAVVSVSSAAAEINSGVLSEAAGSFKGLSFIVETAMEPYGPASAKVSVEGMFPWTGASWRTLSIRGRL